MSQKDTKFILCSPHCFGRLYSVTEIIPYQTYRSELLQQQAGIPFLKRLAYASDVTITGVAGLGADGEESARGMVTVITHAARISMPMAELVDLEKEKARIQKDLGKQKAELEKLQAKLNNPGFVNKAPANVVEAERARAGKLTALIAKLEEQLRSM